MQHYRLKTKGAVLSCIKSGEYAIVLSKDKVRTVKKKYRRTQGQTIITEELDGDRTGTECKFDVKETGSL